MSCYTHIINFNYFVMLCFSLLTGNSILTLYLYTENIFILLLLKKIK
nr:MAG TPA: hypothetical protein [Caudoviricetes sp.]